MPRTSTCFLAPFIPFSTLFVRTRLIFLLWVLGVSLADAAAVNWTYNGSGAWSTGSNWSAGIVPATGDAVTLGNATALRTVSLDLTSATASVSLSSLALTQTTTGVTNKLALTGGAGTVTVGNPFTLGSGNATATGSLLITGTGTSSYTAIPSMVATGVMTLNAGGVLQLAYNPVTTRAFIATAGGLTLNGGLLEALAPGATQTVWLGSTSGSNGAFPGADIFTINSGTIKVHGSGTNASRLGFHGNFNWTGGTVQFVSDTASSTVQGIFLHGLTNTIGSTVTFQTVSTTGVVTAAAPTFTLDIATTTPATATTLSQTLDTSVPLGLMTVREFDTKTNSSYTHRITSTAANPSIGQIYLNTTGAVDIFQLGSNLKSTHTNPTFITAQTGTGIVSATFAVDLNGFSFDGTTAAAGWVPNKLSGTATNWKVTSSTGSGVLKAQSFDLRLSGATNDSFSVGSNATLEATGGAGTGTILSSTGLVTYTFDPASWFRYSGSATTASPATLSSVVAIGSLEVANGTLQISQPSLTAAGDVVVADGGTLDLYGASTATVTLGTGRNLVVDGGTLNMTVNASGGSDRIIGSGGVANLTGCTISLSGTINYDSVYVLFTGFSQIIGSETFAITGYDTARYLAVFHKDGTLSFVPAIVSEVSTLPFTTYIHQWPWQGEQELFGYQPLFKPGPIEFDNDNRPYIRNGENIQTIGDDNKGWINLNFADAVFAQYPDWTDRAFGKGAFFEERVVFDAAGDAYIHVATAYVTSTPTLCNKGLLLYSRDRCRTWQVLPIWNYKYVQIEHRDGHNDRTQTPAILAIANAGGPLSILKVVKNANGTISVSKTQVAADCYTIPIHSGDGNMAVSIGSKVHIVYASSTPVAGNPGTPSYALTYDRVTNTTTSPVLLGCGGTTMDPHNCPAITVDSQGYLHAVFGGHHTPELYYTKSLQPNSTAAWTTPVVFASESLKSTWGHTYPSLLCDKNDKLHVVTRWSGEKYVMKLVSMSKLPTSDEWTVFSGTSRINRLVQPCRGLYQVWHHKLSMDANNTIYISYEHEANELKLDEYNAYNLKWPEDNLIAEGPPPDGGTKMYGNVEPHWPNILQSTDSGATWRMSLTPDLMSRVHWW